MLAAISMFGWDVEEVKGQWVGRFVSHTQKATATHSVHIMPAKIGPREVAIDALLDYMDRLRTGRIPRDIGADSVRLMAICVQASRRQH